MEESFFNIWTAITVGVLGYYFIEYAKVKNKDDKWEELEERVRKLEVVDKEIKEK